MCLFLLKYLKKRLIDLSCLLLIRFSWRAEELEALIIRPVKFGRLRFIYTHIEAEFPITTFDSSIWHWETLSSLRSCWCCCCCPSPKRLRSSPHPIWRGWDANRKKKRTTFFLICQSKCCSKKISLPRDWLRYRISRENKFREGKIARHIGQRINNETWYVFFIAVLLRLFFVFFLEWCFGFCSFGRRLQFECK